MLEIRDLTKTFGSLRAVDGISFHAQPGEIYGLLGPNGAGKTTTISCLCGLLRPDAGGIALDGVELATDPLRFKRMLGIVPQETALYGDLTARENLDFWGRLAGLGGRALGERIDSTLAAVGLADRAREPARKFSGGMRRRLNLAIGMLHEPRLLLLDEPTVGIDIQARLNILDVVRGVAQRGAIILYTTHYLEEAQGLCDRIGIMDQGRILAEGNLDELKRLVGAGGVLSLRGSFKADALRAAVEGDARVRISALEEGRAMLDVGVERGEISSVLTGLLERKLGIDDISIQEPNLQAVFLKLTGRELRD
jgi:ABC-2 type transport system ATP-binding protein